MAFDIQLLLTEIRTTFRDFSSKKSGCSPLTQDCITALLKNIENVQQSSESILNSILVSPQAVIKLKCYLIKRITASLSEVQFVEKYDREAVRSKDPYRIQTSNLSRLMKEILESIKSIDEELKNLKENVEVCERNGVLLTADLKEEYEKMSISCLLRMVMDSSQMDIEQCFDHMLFRMFILEESISLILYKTEKALNSIAERVHEQRLGEAKSPSVKTKRSALSQSIEIYKLNKKRQEEFDRLALRQPHNQNVIKTDYQLVCKEERRKQVGVRRVICCFGF